MKSLRKYARFFYISIIIILALTTLLALYNGGYQIAGGIIAGIAFASVLTSFVPYFIAMYFFKKYEESHSIEVKYKILGFIFFTFCFPVKIWIIFSNLSLLINGGERWGFG